MDAPEASALDAWLSKIRADASPPGTLVVVVRSATRSVAIFPEDIVGKSDDDLLHHITKRLAE